MIKKQKIDNQSLLWLAALLAVAFFVRLYQIQFGKPFLYHPDEIKLVAQAGRLLSTYFMDPQVYFAIGVYPPFFTYLLTIPFALFIVGSLISGKIDSLAAAKTFYETTPFPFFLLSRLTVVIMGVLSVYVLFLIVKHLYGRRLAWIASVLLAVNFCHVQHSHYGTVDIPAAFFAMMAVYAAVHILQKGHRRWYIAAGLFSAMAVATKFSMFFAIIPAIYAHVHKVLSSGFSWQRLFDKNLWALSLALVIGFLVFCPLFILDFYQSKAGMVEVGQFEKEGKLGSGGGLFSYWTGDQAPSFGLFYPSHLPGSFGMALMVLTLLGLLVMILRHTREDVLLLSFTLLTYLLFESIAYKAIRHLIPVVPFFMVAAAMAVEKISTALFRHPLRRWAALIGILLGLIGLQLQRIYTFFHTLSQPDPRTTAYHWILNHIPDGSRIMTESFPPQLPNYFDPKPMEQIRYRLYPIKLTSRRLNLTSEFIHTINDSGVQYYISDGFTRAFFQWEYSKDKYPKVVQERQQFFDWVEQRGERLQIFTPQNPIIQPEIIIYRFNRVRSY